MVYDMVRGDPCAFITGFDSVFNTDIISHQAKNEVLFSCIDFDDTGKLQNM